MVGKPRTSPESFDEARYHRKLRHAGRQEGRVESTRETPKGNEGKRHTFEQVRNLPLCTERHPDEFNKLARWAAA